MIEATSRLKKVNELITLTHVKLLSRDAQAHLPKSKKSIDNYTHLCKIKHVLVMLRHTRLKAKSQLIITLTRVKLLSCDAQAHSPESKKSIDNYTHLCKITVL